MKIHNKKTRTNPCIGIIGGVGPQATTLLYEEIIKAAASSHGAKKNHQFPRVAIVSEPVIDFISSTENLVEAEAQVFSAADRLISAGATMICIASNTVHLFYPKLVSVCQENKVKPISLVKAVSDSCFQKKFQKVGLLASPTTIREKLYLYELQQQGIELIVPAEEDYKILGSIINSVIAGKVSSTQLVKYKSLVSKISGKVDAVILGCTELPLITEELPGVPVVNSTKVLAAALTDQYYQELLEGQS